MKNFYFVFVIFISNLMIANAQTAVYWNSPITVALGSTYSNIFPRINLVNGNTPLITWTNSSTASLYSSIKMGASFMMPVKVNPTGIIPEAFWWSGPESRTAGDTVFVVFSVQTSTTGKIYTVRSIDGGSTYEDTVRADGFMGNDRSRFPAIGIGNSGNPLVSFMRMDSVYADPQWHVSSSTNGGTSFLPDISASNLAPMEACDCCPSAIATSGDKNCVLYRNNNSNIRTIYTAFSNDASASFPQQTQVDLTNWMFMACPSDGPTGVIVGDTLIYAWRSQNTSKIYLGTVNVNDQQIGIHRMLTPFASGTQNYPQIAAKGDTVGIVWQENNAGKTDVYFTYSLTGAAGLGIFIDTLTTGMTATQSRPDIVFNNKKFHVSFSDAVGADVVYMQGDLTNGIGINETNVINDLQIISVQEVNGKIEIKINSPFETSVSIQFVNSNGQKLLNQKLSLNSGTNTYSLLGNLSSGVNYLNLLTSNGKNYSKKVMVLK